MGRTPRRIIKLALAVGAVAVLAPAGAASAATSLPACAPPAFTGGVSLVGLRCVPTCTCTGQRGPRGPRGKTGARGLRGLTGAMGPAGPRGLQGAVGERGPQGEAGPTGQTGPAGPSGQTGATGQTGQTGPPGSTGMTGPPGPAGTTDFAEFFALMPPDNAATVAPGAAVDFPQDAPQSPGGSSTRISQDSFQLSAIGTYRVAYQVSVTEAGQLMLRLNGVDLDYTVVGRATGTTQIVGESLITTTSANSIIEVVNPTGNATALTITPLAGGTRPVSASLVIQRLA